MAKLPLFRTLNKKIKFFELNWDDGIYIHNLTNKFPWGDNTIDVVYSSHTLEHFSREDGIFFLNECYRVLKYHGIIRIIVPNLTDFVNKYIDGKIRADYFVEELGVLYSNPKNSFKNLLALYTQYPHKCMYDGPTLVKIMNDIGFLTECRKSFNSNIPDIKNIELKQRSINALIVEGIKK